MGGGLEVCGRVKDLGEFVDRVWKGRVIEGKLGVIDGKGGGGMLEVDY